MENAGKKGNIGVQVPAELKAEVEKIAAERMTSVSTVIREIIAHFLKTKEVPKNES